MPESGREATPVEVLVKGLRKVVGPEVEWIDANIVRLLLDRYDMRPGAVDEAFAEAGREAALPYWRIECPACGGWLVTHLRDDVTRFLDAHNHVSPPARETT